jgi:hypothetical protein
VNKGRCTLLRTPVIVAAILAGAPGTANASLPSGVTHVAVTAGNTTSGINGHLDPGASISGTIESVAGGKPLSTTVTAYLGGKVAGSASADGAGHYVIGGLAASSTGYAVCVEALNLTAGGSKTGYLGRCYKKALWSGGGIPSGAKKVPLTSGQQRTGIDIKLPVGGAISGRITDASTGKPVKNGVVAVFNSSGRLLTTAPANSTGRYRARGLAAASGDRACAFPTSPSASVSHKGRCWKNVAWSGGKLPSGTTGVRVKLGKTRKGISLKLRRATAKLGSIAGEIIENAGASALQNASVSVYTGGGALAGSASTDGSGNYTVSGLRASASGYVVCATGEEASSNVVTTPTTGWAPRCHADAPWDGAEPPAGATKVPLSGGQDATGIDIALRVGGEIAGTVFVSAGSTPAPGVLVKLYTAGGSFIASTTSDVSTGVYSFTGLSSASYTVCFDGRTSATPSGYLPQCFNQVAWDGNA